MKNTLVHKRYNLAFAFFLMILLVSCSVDDKQKLGNHDWQMTWNDEFDGAAGTLPDATKWHMDIGTGTNGWGNNELQYYTNRPENIAKDGNGNLVITAIRESYQGSSYTSARINSKGFLEQQYGRFEARIKTPYGQGFWPAFWMLGNNIDTSPWPICGEIDIMELRGQAPSTMSSALHGPVFIEDIPIPNAYALTNPFTLINDRFDTDFHVFATEWDENKIDFFVDGYLFKRVSKFDLEAKGKWVFDHPFFLLLNLAVGGDFVGSPNSQTIFPQKMTIDYVRVYK